MECDSVKQILNKIFSKDTSVATLPQYDEKGTDSESSKMDCHETRCVSRNDTPSIWGEIRKEGGMREKLSRKGGRIQIAAS